MLLPRRFTWTTALATTLLWTLSTACGGGANDDRPDATTPTPDAPTAVETQAVEGHCPRVELDLTTQECHEGPTPAGGAYSIGTFLDDNLSPVPREDATKLSIVEYDADGREIQTTLGDLGG